MILSYLIDDLNQNVFDIAIDSILTNLRLNLIFISNALV